MKQIFLSIFLFISFLLLPTITLAQSPSPLPTSTPSTPNSFEMFWPISAGKVAGESMYFLKTLKENVRGMLIFSQFKKAEYNIMLSEKRTVEAEKLINEKKDVVNAKATLQSAIARWNDTWNNIESESNNPNIGSMKERFKSSLEKQRTLYQYLESQSTDEIKSSLNEAITQLDSTLAKVQ